MSGHSGSTVPGPPVSEPTLEDGVAQQLRDSGDKERLKAMLRERLTECGWREDVRRHAREYMLAARNAGNKVTVDDIVSAVRGRGRQRVPDYVKSELLIAIRSSIVNQ